MQQAFRMIYVFKVLFFFFFLYFQPLNSPRPRTYDPDAAEGSVAKAGNSNG